MTETKYETSDVQPRPLVMFAGVLVLLVASAMVLMALMFHYFDQLAERESSPPSPLARVRKVPPAPRLQNMTTQRQDLVSMRAQEESTLSTYGWLDHKAGVVRIPIDRAMELLAQREGKKE